MFYDVIEQMTSFKANESTFPKKDKERFAPNSKEM
jgi:hypothetical protein